MVFIIRQLTIVGIHIGLITVRRVGVRTILVQVFTPPVGGRHIVMGLATWVIIRTITGGTTIGATAIILIIAPHKTAITQPVMKLLD